MSRPVRCRCPVIDLDQYVAQHDVIIAPSSAGISAWWPCIFCGDELHRHPLSPQDFDRMSRQGFDFAHALGGDSVTASQSPAGAVPPRAPAEQNVPAAVVADGEAAATAAGTHVLVVGMQPGGAGVYLAVECCAAPGADCRYAEGRRCRAADSINGAGVAARYVGACTRPIRSGMPILVALLIGGWFWDLTG